MEAVTLRRLSDLQSCMNHDPRLAALSSAEARLIEDPEGKALFEKANLCRNEYLRLRLETGADSEETKAAQRLFHEAKLALDECPSSKEYSALFSEWNWVLREIDAILFAPFREKGRKCHD